MSGFKSRLAHQKAEVFKASAFVMLCSVFHVFTELFSTKQINLFPILENAILKIFSKTKRFFHSFNDFFDKNADENADETIDRSPIISGSFHRTKNPPISERVFFIICCLCMLCNIPRLLCWPVFPSLWLLRCVAFCQLFPRHHMDSYSCRQSDPGRCVPVRALSCGAL